MIGRLRGFIDLITHDKVILDVMGVGYVVFISNKTAQFLNDFYENNQENNEKKPISLIIETIVKEDSIELFGFFEEIEKIWFLELNKVQGVGAKMALKILGQFSIKNLVENILCEDVKAFNQISGIGPKLAQRLVVELKNSPKKLGVDIANFNIDEKTDNNQVLSNNNLAKDAVSALENLGYKKNEINKIVALNLKENPEITLENLITLSLRGLAK